MSLANLQNTDKSLPREMENDRIIDRIEWILGETILFEQFSSLSNLKKLKNLTRLPEFLLSAFLRP